MYVCMYVCMYVPVCMYVQYIYIYLYISIYKYKLRSSLWVHQDKDKIVCPLYERKSIDTLKCLGTQI
jgi:hypothetical protein